MKMGGGGMEISTFDDVRVNTFGFCDPSKLVLRWRYVNMNIKTKDISFMLNIS